MSFIAIRFSIPNQESIHERIMSRVEESHHTTLAGKNLVLDVGFRHTVAVGMHLVTASTDRNICRDVCRQLLHRHLPQCFPISVSDTGELQVDKYPVFELTHKRFIVKAQIVAFRGHRKALHGALNGVPSLIQLRIERDYVDDERAVLVKPRLLLDDDGVLVLDPGLEHRTAIIHGITPGVVVILDKADENASHSAAVDGQIRNVDFQLVAGLVVGIHRVKRELGVQDHVVLRLIILEGYLAGSEVISNTVEHIRCDRGLVDDARPEAFRGYHVIAATVGESHLGFTAIVADIDQVGLRDNLAVSTVSAAQADAGTDDVCRKLTVQINLGRSDIAMAQTHCVELSHRSAGGEVHIQ